MSRVLVDSNVLLDVIGERGQWAAWSEAALQAAAILARLVVNPVVFAEVSVRYSRIEDLDAGRISCQEPVSGDGGVGSDEKIRERRGPHAAAPSIVEERLAGEEGRLVRQRLTIEQLGRQRRYRTYCPGLDLITPA
jgi:predicted nucleic acid-binding protein